MRVGVSEGARYPERNEAAGWRAGSLEGGNDGIGDREGAGARGIGGWGEKYGGKKHAEREKHRRAESRIGREGR